MNDSQFEVSLRALRPPAPPASLEERIGSGLFDSTPSPATAPIRKEREPVSIRFEQAREPLLVRCFHSLGWAIAGAASAVAAIALYPAKPAPERPLPPTVGVSAPIHQPPAIAVSHAASQAAIPKVIPASASLPAASKESGEIPGFQSLETTRELVSTEEDGQVLYQDGNHPMRQVRYRYHEHHAWSNPRTGARVDVEIPREDVFLKPVSLQ